MEICGPGLIAVPIPAEVLLEDERRSFNDAYLFFQEGVFCCQAALRSVETSRKWIRREVS
jgi:hypothetical protein